jgi:YbbR domain-containing protein
MKKDNILKQEIMFGLLFILIGLIIGWLLFVQPVFDEKNTLQLEKQGLSRATESREIKVTPNQETVLAIKYSKQSLNKKDVLARVLRAESASGADADLSITNGQTEISLTANPNQQELFLKSLMAGPSFNTDGQIVNRKRSSLLPIEKITVSPDALKITGQ